MTDTVLQSTTARSHGGFSLASLAVLVTVFAAFLTAIDVRRCREVLYQLWIDDRASMIGAFVMAMMIGAAIGVVRLFFGGFSWRMLLLAPVGGAVAGVVGMLVLIAPGPLWRSVLAVVLLLMTTNLIRLGSD